MFTVSALCYNRRMKTRNSDLLQSFVAYCEAHPQERFWQALRNWCGWSFVLLSSDTNHADNPDIQDTFYWEDNQVPPD
jgi:hypothetical protein